MISLNINMAKCATIMLVLQQIVQGQNDKNLSQDNVCQNENENTHCCSGYYWHDGKCIECFGAFGLNCSEPCHNISFGYRCRKTCKCQNHEVCNKYTGCQTIDYINNEFKDKCKDTLLLSVIGSGSVLLSMALLFIGVMFYRWRKMLYKPKSAEKTEGFQVDLFTVPSIQDIIQENYDDIRESRMLLDGNGKSNKETTPNRINSTEYNRLFCKERTSSKTMSEMGEECYTAIDARFKSKQPLVTLSEFPEDDCYVSLAQNTKRNKRMSKSCSDITVDTSGVYNYVGINQYYNSKVDKNNGNILIAHL
ncbi:uncharacterized protein LOC128169912 isoform X1 [Crassostrea angulata]|uniref:uncharacterized protein LOC128169912 isoform X1 n=1 Tax=Magallana angulata TaxID=2784310 RepID=UPI0022B0A6F3|nr:uncharacterized protein LOC128169912 isoform X1 [Crassostrea angulata]